MDPRRREVPHLPVVHFFDREPPHTLPSGGGTTCEHTADPRIEGRYSGLLVRGGLTALLMLLASYSFSCVSVVVQEFEFRRDVSHVRNRIVALDAEIGAVAADDVITAVRDVADVAGIEVDPGDIEIVAAPVEIREAPGRRCHVARLPREFDRLSVDDQRRFDGSPIRCDETRWIVGFRAQVRATSLLTSSAFTVERYTWVDEYRPGGAEVVARR